MTIKRRSEVFVTYLISVTLNNLSLYPKVTTPLSLYINIINMDKNTKEKVKQAKLYFKEKEYQKAIDELEYVLMFNCNSLYMIYDRVSIRTIPDQWTLLLQTV
jgi:hypothetical protein